MMRFVLLVTVLLMWEPRLLSAQEKFIPRPDTTLVADRRAEREPAALEKIVIYKPKYLPASEAADLLQAFLAGRSGTVLAEPVSNALVIRGSESQLKEIQAVLNALDKPVKMIAFDIIFADLPAKAEDLKEQSTSDETWLARLKDNAGNPKANISKLRLTATETNQATVQFGGQTPVVTGVERNFGGRGAAPTRSPILQQRQTGTIVKCTARVLENDTILAEFEIERSQLAPEAGALLEESDDNGAVRTPGISTVTCKTTLKLKPGKPRVISGLRSQTAKGGTVQVIAITAELVTPE